MHFSFIPYGKRAEVELLIRDMEAQKHKLIMTKDKQQKAMWIQGQVRLLPFGIYEYVFPKEDLDKVLTTLQAKNIAYNFKQLPLKIIRKFLKLNKIPKYEEEGTYLWIRDNVSIFPVGIREDLELTDPLLDGYRHEAI